MWILGVNWLIMNGLRMWIWIPIYPHFRRDGVLNGVACEGAKTRRLGDRKGGGRRTGCAKVLLRTEMRLNIGMLRYNGMEAGGEPGIAADVKGAKRCFILAALVFTLSGSFASCVAPLRSPDGDLVVLDC